MKELLYRKLTEAIKEKCNDACDRVIDLLNKELKLEDWEAYYTIKILYDSIPVISLEVEKEDK